MVDLWNCRLAVFAALCTAIFQVAGCPKAPNASQGIVFACTSDRQPPCLGRNAFTVSLTYSSGALVTGAHVSFEGDMSHPGMSPIFAEAKEVSPGHYQGALDLNMLGDWTVLVHITLAGGQSFDRTIELRNLRAT